MGLAHVQSTRRPTSIGQENLTQSRKAAKNHAKKAFNRSAPRVHDLRLFLFAALRLCVRLSVQRPLRNQLQVLRDPGLFNVPSSRPRVRSRVA